MANRNVQLHKKNDTSELWYPLTNGDCVKLTGYSKGSTGGAIAPTDTLNIALGKLENNTASVYTAMGSVELNSTNVPTLGGNTLSGKTINGQQLKVGYVYNITNTTVTRADFIEGADKPIPAGTNIVVVKSGNNYYYDVLAMSVAGGGSGTVYESEQYKLAYYASGGDAVSGCNVKYNGSALSVTGDVYASGGVTALYTSSSDRRLKDDIKPFNAMEIVDKLNPVSFKWNDKAKELSDAFGDEINYGLIAQDSEGVMDKFVFDMPNDYKGIHYERLVPVLLQAIKEQQGEINKLTKRITELENK